MKTTKDEIQDWLTVVENYLQEAEQAFESKNLDLAEGAVFQARDNLRHVRAATLRLEPLPEKQV